MYGGQMHGFWGAGWLIGLVLFVVFVVAIVLLVIWAVRQTQRNASESYQDQGSLSAENILKERYARGEISRDEYLSMQEDLRD